MVSKMADLHSGAYVNISVAIAKACQDGVFQTRSPPELRKHTIGLSFLCPNGTVGRIYIYRPEHHDPQERRTYQ